MKINNVNNVPQYAIGKTYWIVFRLDGEFWFWQATNDRDLANRIAIDRGDCAVWCMED